MIFLVSSPVMYEYDDMTMEGVTSVLDVVVPIVVLENGSEFVSCASVNHANQLSYKLYDPERNFMVFEKPDESLADYLAGMPKVGDFNQILYIHPNIRKIFRDIMKFVVDMHAMGRHVGDFTIDNLKMKDGVVKFCGVPIPIVLNESTPQVPANCRMQNLLNVRDVFLKVVPTNAPHPRDYANFITRFHSHINPAEANSLLHHFCVMPPESIIHFCMNIGSTPRVPQMCTWLHCAIAKLGDPKGWERRLNEPGFVDLWKAMTKEGTRPLNTNSTELHKRKEGMVKEIRNVAMHSNKMPFKLGEDPMLKLQVLLLNAFMEELCILRESLCDRADPHKWFTYCSAYVT